MMCVDKYNNTAMQRLGCKRVPGLFIIVLLCIAAPSVAEENKNYLRLERSLPNERDDLTVTSIGGLIFTDNTEVQIDLSYMESDANGNGMTLGVGGGYVINWTVSLYAGAGAVLGYNWTNQKYLTAVYPEAGITVDLGDNFGLSVSARRYFYLYDDHESLINIGLLFRN